MDLIERYLQAVGRLLPDQQRDDILSELRSSLYDSLESGDQPPTEEAIVKAIKSMGPPEKAAAAYYPAGQYVIGPALYPTFRLVIGIVFTVLITLHIVSAIGSAALGGNPLLGNLGNLIQTLPAALGIVVLVFWSLQRLEINPSSNGAEFNPLKLPALEANPSQVSRGSMVFDIALNVVVVGILARFTQQGGFRWIDGGGFFEHPVIEQFFPWIVMATAIDIGLRVLLLWRGFWQRSTRIADLISNLVSFGLIWLLFQGHETWLTNAGAPSMFDGLKGFIVPESAFTGMMVFRSIFGVALVISFVGCVSSAYYVYRTFTHSSQASNGDVLIKA